MGPEAGSWLPGPPRDLAVAAKAQRPLADSAEAFRQDAEAGGGGHLAAFEAAGRSGSAAAPGTQPPA